MHCMKIRLFRTQFEQLDRELLSHSHQSLVVEKVIAVAVYWPRKGDYWPRKLQLHFSAVVISCG